MSRWITFFWSKITEISRESPLSKLSFRRKTRVWRKLWNQRIWDFQLCIWKVCLRGFAPQTHSSMIKLSFSNSLISQISSNSNFPSKWKVGKKTFPWISVICSRKTWFIGSYQISSISSTLTKISKFWNWPEIGKYLSDRSEPKCGNGEEHFKIAFSWVKCQIFSYFARYFREKHCRTWLGTP